MAKEMSYTDATGVVRPASYWNLPRIQLNSRSKICVAYMQGFTTQALRATEGVVPFEDRVFTVEGELYDQYFGSQYQSQAGYNLEAATYLALENVPDFASFFANATDVLDSQSQINQVNTLRVLFG